MVHAAAGAAGNLRTALGADCECATAGDSDAAELFHRASVVSGVGWLCHRDWRLMVMGIPIYRLQIADLNGHVVVLPAGGRLERDFIRECSAAIVRRGVGVWKTEAHVRADIEAGLTEVIRELKWETR